MTNPMFALLIVVSFQARVDDRPLPKPRGQIDPAIRVMIQGKQASITFEIPAPGDQDDDNPVVRPARRINLQTATLERQNFDRWLFEDERSDAERRTHLEELLQAKIEVAGLDYSLTDRQRTKLRVAGRGDIKRFFDDVEDRRTAFEVERRSVKTGLAALRRLDALAPLYRSGPFGESSLFAKTLCRIKDDQNSGH
jgi:hypothetical protein